MTTRDVGFKRPYATLASPSATAQALMPAVERQTRHRLPTPEPAFRGDSEAEPEAANYPAEAGDGYASDPNRSADLTELLLIASAYRQTETLAAAIELKVFSALAGGPCNAATLATRLRLSARAADKLMGALLAMKLVQKHDGDFSNSWTANRYLVADRELYLGDGILFLKTLGQRTWSTLTSVLTEGQPVGAQLTGEPDAEFWRKLTVAIRPLTLPVAESLCNILRQLELKDPKILDLAGGSGVFGQKMLLAYPTAQAVQVDWPGVNEIARQYAEKLGVSDRFQTYDGDLLQCEWLDQQYDVVVLSHFLHQESEQNCRKLIARVKRALKPTGRIVINEYCLNTQKTDSKYSLFFALSMLLQNTAGDAYSVDQYVSWLTEAGLTLELIYSPVPPSTVIVGQLDAAAPERGSIL